MVTLKRIRRGIRTAVILALMAVVVYDQISVACTIGGKTKKHVEDIVLRDKSKPYSETVSGGYKIYELRQR
ncbi:hypothetical protein [Paenibacillus sp. S150]|uniref:hypothetical protein n=1 Tax=Paenibacillus sp. S150 TaxID=2749826 RepID=UPI001C59E3E1|nr:hypothetical protein [Paenibacillus sp. S150]MBW4082955.1 hypothetical protein [Paenibacillus sp. S150]